MVIRRRLLFVKGWWLRQLIVLIEQVAGQLSSLPDLLLDPGLVSLFYLVLKLLGEAFLAEFSVPYFVTRASETYLHRFKFYILKFQLILDR